MNHIETMKQALEALEDVRIEYDFHGNPLYDEDKKIDPAITVLRQAIEQAEKQKPVAWMDVVGYEDKYEVSSLGDIRNKKTGKILSKSLMGAGYIKADLWDGNRRWQTSAHRIVAAAFIDNPEDLKEVNHINGIKTDNRASNLEWVSRSDNVNHSYYELGNQIKPVIATNIKTREAIYYPSINAAERDGFHSAHIINVIKGNRLHHKGFTFDYHTAPPKREWQGLTYEEISASVDICEQNVKGEFLVEFARAIEAKLKEKNHVS